MDDPPLFGGTTDHFPILNDVYMGPDTHFDWNLDPDFFNLKPDDPEPEPVAGPSGTRDWSKIPRIGSGFMTRKPLSSICC
jgi:hypothetical protein